MGQPPDKTYRICKQQASSVGQLYGTGGNVKGGEKLIFRKDSCVGEGIQKSGFSNICVANDSGSYNVVLFSPVPYKLSALPYFFKVVLQNFYPAADMAPVRFKL